MAEESQQEKLRGYLAAQSAKLSAGEIRQRFQGAGEEFLAAVGEANETTDHQAPAAGEWSVAEVVDHVTLTLDEVLGIMRTLARSERPTRQMTVGAEPVNASRSLAELVKRLKSSHADAIQFLSAQETSPEPHLDLRVPDHDFGELNWKGYALILRLHYKDHTQQVRKTLAAVAGGAQR